MSSSSAWMLTYSGRVFHPLAPQPEQVAIIDIAHSLANQCRFAGHCRVHYSVAQHSVYVSDLLRPLGVEAQLAGLLHDAAEAYLVDLPSPVKVFMTEYCASEKIVTAAIWKAFEVLVPENTAAIKTADNIVLATEMRDLMAPVAAPRYICASSGGSRFQDVRPAAKAYSWARNSIRRLVDNKRIKRVEPGTYLANRP